jgi:membrane protein
MTMIIIAALLPQDAQNAARIWVAENLASQAAQLLGVMLSSLKFNTTTGIAASLLSIGFLLYSSTTLFSQLKLALDEIWEVQPVHSPLIVFFFRHIVGLLALIASGFALATIVAVGTILQRLGLGMRGNFVGSTVMTLLEFAFTFTTVFIITAAVYKRLPSVRLEWRDVWLAAAVTSLVFTVAKYPLQIYLTRYADESTYGMAGTVLIVLFTIYVLGLIFLYGGVFCRAYALRYGSKTALNPSQAME